jgi:uncharacterized protein (DUF433 family)
MQLEEYFDFLGPDNIRIRGSRVGIETILHDYLKEGRAPEAIQRSYPTLSLEEIYATILYYLHNKPAVDHYMAEWYEFGERMREEQRRNPSPAVARLVRLMEERRTANRQAT